MQKRDSSLDSGQHPYHIFPLSSAIGTLTPFLVLSHPMAAAPHSSRRVETKGCRGLQTPGFPTATPTRIPIQTYPHSRPPMHTHSH